MNGKLVSIGIAAALFVGALGCAFMAGDSYRDNAWAAKQAAAERAAKKDYEAEVARGDKATTALITAQRQHAANYKNFERQFNELRLRAPLLALRVLPAGATVPKDDEAVAGATDADTRHFALSAGAVWMWNTALAGTDQPTGACGAASTTTAACAVATALTLDDAWDNHNTNAQICAANRLAHQELIDFLTRRDKQRESIKP